MGAIGERIPIRSQISSDILTAGLLLRVGNLERDRTNPLLACFCAGSGIVDTHRNSNRYPHPCILVSYPRKDLLHSYNWRDTQHPDWGKERLEQQCRVLVPRLTTRHLTTPLTGRCEKVSS